VDEVVVAVAVDASGLFNALAWDIVVEVSDLHKLNLVVNVVWFFNYLDINRLHGGIRV